MAKSKKRRPRYLQQVGFQLDTMKPTEKKIYDQTKELAAKHKKAETVRDGFKLVYALRYEDDLSVLREMFPEVYHRIRNEALEDGFAELKKLIVSGQVVVNPPAQPGPKPLNGGMTQIAMPTFDDDEGDDMPLAMKKDEGADLNASLSFLSAAFKFKRSDDNG